MINQEILEEIGLSKGESKVYAALLDTGESSVGPLSKKAEVTQSKIYPIINKLIKKGLCTEIIKSGTRYFEATNPKRIIDFLEEKNKKINEEKDKIKKLIPKIEEHKKFSKNPQTARVYQTFQGLKTLYEEILEELKGQKKDFIGFTLGREEYHYKESEYFFMQYDTKRRKLGIKTKLLGYIKQKKFIDSITKKDKNIEVRYLHYNLPTGIIIFGNKVATLVWTEIPTAFVIESKQIAESYEKFFWDMWKIAKK